MKMCRAVLIVTIFSLFTVTLSGCVIIPLEKNFIYDAEEVSAIDIYDLSAFDSNSSEDILSLEPYYTLDESERKAFLSDLAEIQYTDAVIIVLAAIDPSFDYGSWTIKITFCDGSFRLMSCNGYGENFDSNGKRTKGDHYGCDNDEWDNLIESYLPEELIKNKNTEIIT